jgi:signal transduction histidine kinase
MAVAAALLGLIALLATLQYRWLGRISDAQRERMTATLNSRAGAFAQDFDRELTLAYMLFQVESALPGASGEQGLPERLAARYERWQATARYPRLIREIYVASREGDSPATLDRFNPAARTAERSEWPSSLAPIRANLNESREEKSSNGTMVVRTMAPALWDQVPAIVVPGAPTPFLFLGAPAMHAAARLAPTASLTYIVLVLDRQVMVGEMLPALAAHHFSESSENIRYQVAVVDPAASTPVFRSTAEFSPSADTKTDAAADLFQVRPQEFPQVAADVRRFTALALPGTGSRTEGHTVTTFTLPVERAPLPAAPSGSTTAATSQVIVREARPSTLVLGQAAIRDRTFVTTLASGRSGARWRLLVKHPAGSLEAAVDATRRRNLVVSMSILGVLAASMVLMAAAVRRSHELARRQMEFVATVSHELRTPLAVMRAAADNLAEGVVHDQDEVRKYGELVRSEGRRLTEMVEQILEFAGIHSGQRTLNLTPVRVDGLIDSVLRASATLIDAARLDVQVAIPADLPPVIGDESALRRVFQNLVGNAIKYGASGGWIGIEARRAGAEVGIAISDRGIGIAPADQERIFEPFYRAADVVDAQMQGAGLGLSLVLRIVQAHGGRIAVKSAKDAGSQFTVFLPIGTEQTAGQSSTVGADAAAPASHLS